MSPALERCSIVACAVLAFAVGCGDSGAPASPGAGGAPSSPSSPSSSSSSSSSGGAAAEGGAAASSDVPAEPTALNAWLQTGAYKAWPHESAPHPSAGPHGGSVQTYINEALDASLAAGSAEHPKGAAAVKELFTSGTVSGWAVLVKTQDASEQGNGFYWYEVFDTAPGASPIDGQGLGTCTGCHSSGSDYVRAPYPLQ